MTTLNAGVAHYITMHLGQRTSVIARGLMGRMRRIRHAIDRQTCVRPGSPWGVFGGFPAQAQGAGCEGGRVAARARARPGRDPHIT